MPSSQNTTPTLRVGGAAYAGWRTFSVSRALDRMCSDFAIDVAEQWLGQAHPWRITPFAKVEVAIGDDPILTGYVERYEPSLDMRQHVVAIRGRSATGDLVECCPDVPSGQFRGYNLLQIARSLCAPFGIAVVDEVGTYPALADTTIQRAETAYRFLDRLARLSGVLLLDDERGRLVLARAGVLAADDELRQGENVVRVGAVLDVSKRFSRYVVKGQVGAGGAAQWGGFGGIGTTAPAAVPATTDLEAVATDADVPRYRPHVTLAESGLDLAGMQRRARWIAAVSAGRSLAIRVEVRGWRQSTGTLWQCNRLVRCSVPFLDLAGTMLISGVRFYLDGRLGQVTELVIGPPSGFTPDPGSVKLRKAKKGAGAPDWSGWGGQ